MYQEKPQNSAPTTSTTNQSIASEFQVTKEGMEETYLRARTSDRKILESYYGEGINKGMVENLINRQCADNRGIGDENISISSRCAFLEGKNYNDSRGYAFILDGVSSEGDENITKIGQALYNAVIAASKEPTISCPNQKTSVTVVLSCGNKVWTAFVGDTLASYVYEPNSGNTDFFKNKNATKEIKMNHLSCEAKLSDPYFIKQLISIGIFPKLKEETSVCYGEIIDVSDIEFDEITKQFEYKCVVKCIDSNSTDSIYFYDGKYTTVQKPSNQEKVQGNCIEMQTKTAERNFNIECLDHNKFNFIEGNNNEKYSGPLLNVSFHKFTGDEKIDSIIISSAEVNKYLSGDDICNLVRDSNGNELADNMSKEALRRNSKEAGNSNENVIVVTMKQEFYCSDVAQIAIVCDGHEGYQIADRLSLNIMPEIIKQLMKFNIIEKNELAGKTLIPDTIATSTTEISNNFINQNQKIFIEKIEMLKDLFNRYKTNYVSLYNRNISFSPIYQLIYVDPRFYDQVWNEQNVRNAIAFISSITNICSRDLVDSIDTAWQKFKAWKFDEREIDSWELVEKNKEEGNSDSDSDWEKVEVARPSK